VIFTVLSLYSSSFIMSWTDCLHVCCGLNRYISTFRAGFIGHQKYCWACRTILPLTCGVSAVF